MFWLLSPSRCECKLGDPASPFCSLVLTVPTDMTAFISECLTSLQSVCSTTAQMEDKPFLWSYLRRHFLYWWQTPIKNLCHYVFNCTEYRSRSVWSCLSWIRTLQFRGINRVAGSGGPVHTRSSWLDLRKVNSFIPSVLKVICFYLVTLNHLWLHLFGANLAFGILGALLIALVRCRP